MKTIFLPIKRLILNPKKVKEEIKEVKEKPLFETRCPYGEDEIVIKSDSAVTANQIDQIVDIIERDYYQSERELSDIGITISRQTFDSQKIVQVTDSNNIEVIVLSDIWFLKKNPTGIPVGFHS